MFNSPEKLLTLWQEGFPRVDAPFEIKSHSLVSLVL